MAFLPALPDEYIQVRYHRVYRGAILSALDARVLNALGAQLCNNGLNRRREFACKGLQARIQLPRLPSTLPSVTQRGIREMSRGDGARPPPLDEPIEASELMLAFHHRLLLYHQSTRNQEDQNSLFDPNKVTDLTLRIMAPGPDIFTVVAKNCPNLRVLTVYDGVDFQPGNPVEVPYRFAKEWATGLAGLHTIEKLTYVWTLDSPRDGAIEAPGRTRLTTRWDEDAERRTVSILVADSQSIQEITFAVFRPFIANQSDRECMARKVTWRKQSSADWTVEVQNEVEL